MERRVEEAMTATPDGPLRDEDMQTTGGPGSASSPQVDADGTDGDATDTVDGDAADADGTDADAADADGTDADSTDATDR